MAFRDRKDSGVIVLDYRKDLPDAVDEFDEIRCDIQCDTIIEQYRYMFSQMNERVESLDSYINYRQSILLNNGYILSPVGEPTQDEITICGRICKNDDAYLDNDNIVIEGNRNESGGARMKLNISHLSSYNFFPGQIVGLKGKSPNGRDFFVDEVIDRFSFQPRLYGREIIEDYNLKLQNKPFTIYYSNGPYSLISDLLYEPLDEYINKILESKPKPDVVIFV